MTVIKVSTEEMKKQLKDVIDRIDIGDGVSYSVNWIKEPGEEDYVASIIIEIEKYDEDDI